MENTIRYYGKFKAFQRGKKTLGNQNGMQKFIQIYMYISVFECKIAKKKTQKIVFTSIINNGGVNNRIHHVNYSGLLIIMTFQ